MTAPFTYGDTIELPNGESFLVRAMAGDYVDQDGIRKRGYAFSHEVGATVDEKTGEVITYHDTRKGATK